MTVAQKLLVLTKEVAELEDDFEIAGDRVDETYLEHDLNQFDEYAVEEAVGIKEEADDDVEVVAVSIGPERAEETIRMVLAKGADRAVRVWDDALEGRAVLDPSSKVAVFEAVVEREDPDLILCGAQADDDLFCATGVALAEAVGFQWAAVVIDLAEYDPAAGQALVHRELEGGVEEITEVDLPAVLTIQTGINEPRYASLRGIRQAQRKDLDVLGLEDLGLDASVLESPIRLEELHEPETDVETSYFDGDASEMAQQLSDLLRDKGVVQT